MSSQAATLQPAGPDLIEVPITPRDLAEIRRRWIVRGRWPIAVLIAACLAAGYGTWKAGRHLVAASWLGANGIHVHWEVKSGTWMRGGATTVQARAQGFLGSGLARADDLTYLKDLHRVVELDLALIDGLRDVDLAVIERLNDLRVLDLDRSRHLDRSRPDGLGPTDATLARLRGLRRLREISLARTRITDAGLAHLAGLADLETLDLTQTGITDAGLGSLRGLKRLGTLVLTGTRVTPGGIRGLEAAMPGVVVIYDPPAPGPR